MLIETNKSKHFTNKTVLDKSISKVLNQRYAFFKSYDQFISYIVSQLRHVDVQSFCDLNNQYLTDFTMSFLGWSLTSNQWVNDQQILSNTNK